MGSQAQIHIREFNWQQDWRDLLQLIYDSWFFDDPPLIGYMSAAQFGLHYISQATTCLVAENDEGKMMGLLSLDNKVDAPIIERSKWSSWQCNSLERLALCGLYLFPKAKISRLFNAMFINNYHKLRKLAPHAQWPEFVLLIVSPHAKRMGIGRKLTEAGEAALRQQGFGHYYLLTDSSCDYQFYDRLQMERVVDVAMDFTLSHIEGYDHYLNSYLRCYVYEQDLSRTAPVDAAGAASGTAPEAAPVLKTI